MTPRWNLWIGLVWMVLGLAAWWLSAANLFRILPEGDFLDHGGRGPTLRYGPGMVPQVGVRHSARLRRGQKAVIVFNEPDRYRAR